MSKRAWVLAILVGTFLLIGSQFRCSNSGSKNNLVAVATVTINPGGATLTTGATEAFSATVAYINSSSHASQSVTWSVQEGASGGSITQQGVYTAPATPGSYTVVASSDLPGQGQITVTVVSPKSLSVSVSPPSANLLAQNSDVMIFGGGTQLFTATVLGSTNSQVNWSVDQDPSNNPGLGSVDTGGVFRAGVYSGLYYVRATPASDTSNPGGYAVVNVTYPSTKNVIILAAPNSAKVMPGGTQSFTATINGAASTAVDWQVVEGPVGGTISASGVYTAPTTTGVYNILATAQADPTQTSIATVAVVPPAGPADVFAAGYSFASGMNQVTVPGYWQDGTWVGLTALNPAYSNTSGTGPVGNQVNALLVSGTDLFAAGDNFNNAGVDVPGYWLNGTWIGLTPLDPTQNSSVQALAMAPDGSLYAGGYSTDSAGVPMPGYWVISNGGSVWTSLPVTPLLVPTLTGGQVNAMSIVPTFSGGFDVYAAGTVISADTALPAFGAVWLNGVLWNVFEPLGGGNTSSSDGTGLFVSGINIYVSSNSLVNGIPGDGYWDTNSWNLLAAPTGLTVGRVTSITGDGTNVYVGGYCISQTGSYAGYWLNGAWIGLTPAGTAQTGGVNTLALSGADVFAAGYYTNGAQTGQPGYWLDGTWVGLPALPQSQGGQVNAIEVIPTPSVKVSVLPQTATVPVGGTQQFTATVTGTANPAVTWSVVEGMAGGTVVAGFYTAPATAGVYHVLATSQADPTKSAEAVVTVLPPVMVTLAPPAVTLTVGGTQQFTATVTGSANPAVTWSVVEGTAGGTVVAGLYTAPATPGVYHVQATSQADPTKSAQSVVTVLASTEVMLTLTPMTATVPAGGTQLFTAAVTGSTNTAVTWSVVEGNAGGTVVAGLYTAPGTGGVFHVLATSQADPTKSAEAVVTVLPPVLVTLAPPTVTLPAGGTQQFIATVTGSTNTAVTWSVVEGSPGGTVVAGLYTAPGTAGVFHVQATSQADPTKSAQSVVTVVVPTTLPAELALPPSVHPGDTWMQASVLPVQGGETYLWSLPTGTSSGSIGSGQGTDVIAFTAGSAIGDFQVEVAVQNGTGGSATVQRTVAIQTGTWLVEDGAPVSPRSGATATVLPSGRVLVAGGQDSYATVLASAEIYDPATGAWFATGPMANPRQYHTATLLADGTVLVAGGSGGSGTYLDSAEIFNPAAGTWAPASGTLGTARQYHTATRLSDGTVLVAGGLGQPGNLASCEIYTPGTGWTTLTGTLNMARQSHTATLLQDHTVLVAGGTGSTGTLASSEIFTPSAGTWAPTGSLNTARVFHTSTLLNDGTVLAVGGTGSAATSLASTEVYATSTGMWTAVGSLGTARTYHTATLLANGNVLAVGGESTYVSQTSAEIYDSTHQTWSATASLATARSYQTAALLGDGTVLVAGGQDNSQALASSEIFNPQSVSWTSTSAHVSARQNHTATLLAGGTVLVAAGESASNTALATALVYTPATRLWASTGSLNTARNLHSATLLASSGKVLVAGGQNSGTEIATAEIWDPSSGLWTTTGNLVTARYGHTATRLGDGTVLVTGGYGSLGLLASAEIYDPTTGVWTGTGPMASARVGHTATLLANGKVLVTGGESGTGPLNRAEIYDPAAKTWSLVTATMTTGREFHTATLLADNVTVLIAGGTSSSANTVASAELFDSGAMTFTATGPMAAPRQYYPAILLPGSGKVLVVGGWSYPGGQPVTLSGCEIYDPVAGTWSATGALNAARYYHTSTLLNDGTILTAFGESADVVSEIYLP